MNLTKHTLCTHVRPEVSGLHIRLNYSAVLTMGPHGLGGFFPPRLPFGFPWVPLQVIRSVVEIRPNFSSFFFGFNSTFFGSEHFGALRRCLYRLLLRRRRGHRINRLVAQKQI